MISYAEALRRLEAATGRLPPAAVPLAAAAGRVTATPVEARLTVPGFANAAMDGFALDAAATVAATPGRPARFKVLGLVAAGSAPPADGPGKGQAWEIATGAPVPAGCDAVIPVERTSRDDAGNVLVTTPVARGQNVRRAGEDFTTGQVVVAAGVRLEPHHVMGLAACGVDEATVTARPRVAILTTGTELEQRGADLAPGRIRDANGPYLAALLPQLGADAAVPVSAGDDEHSLRDRLAALAGTADLVLTTGGVSAGRLDLLPGVVLAMGGEILFHKVAIRPGKPVLAARLPGGALLLGLPGNPLAVAVGMRFFAIPVLRALEGLPPEVPARTAAAEPVRGRGTLRFFAKACIDVGPDGQRRVRLLPGQESFRIAPLLAANCWAVVPEGTGELPAGTLLETLPLQP